MSVSMSPFPNLPCPTYDSAYYDGVLPKRLFAWIIDVALVLTVMIALSIFTIGVAFVLWVPVHFAVSFLYRWQTIKARSATWGMRIMNIELRGPNGNYLTGPEAALHTVSYLLSAVFFVVQLLSIAMMIGRPYNRSLSDELTGAVMVNRSA